ncbi:hypothetical protein SAMN05446037_1002101 [Anaerovirgula multivorans]|uniref:Uncharacterized protein n=1 Tax=Anaerovirgula multivorans TaxID=312168 RepID=A0A239AM33_9FIRM|nr:hypothetical protein [Anaerovirgula multivorans]SNR95993.1 hypothetical protein SAMN05446037_1002101 [Anaerovirgula multivorans]
MMFKHWSDIYPHNVNASVLLLDGKIYNWKIGNQWWEDPAYVKVRLSDYIEKKDRFTVKNKAFQVNNDFEHNRIFEHDAKEWFKQFEIHEKHIGSPPF